MNLLTSVFTNYTTGAELELQPERYYYSKNNLRQHTTSSIHTIIRFKLLRNSVDFHPPRRKLRINFRNKNVSKSAVFNTNATPIRSLTQIQVFGSLRNVFAPTGHPHIYKITPMPSGVIQNRQNFTRTNLQIVFNQKVSQVPSMRNYFR